LAIGATGIVVDAVTIIATFDTIAQVPISTAAYRAVAQTVVRLQLVAVVALFAANMQLAITANRVHATA
jgi:hypothetical protein